MVASLGFPVETEKLVQNNVQKGKKAEAKKKVENKSEKKFNNKVKKPEINKEKSLAGNVEKKGQVAPQIKEKSSLQKRANEDLEAKNPKKAKTNLISKRKHTKFDEDESTVKIEKEIIAPTPAKNDPPVASKNANKDRLNSLANSLLSATGSWHSVETYDPFVQAGPLPRPKIETLKLAIADKMQKLPAVSVSSQSDFKFLSAVLTSGTISDKLAAMSLLLSQHPLAHSRYLESMVTMCSGGRREMLMSLDAVKDSFLNLLPERKCKWFYEQQLTFAHLMSFENNTLTKSQTVFLHSIWFEDFLKRQYLTFLSNLEAALSDNSEIIRTKCLNHCWDLLDKRPEGERTLLALIVNKMADTSRKVASKSCYLLHQLINAHPSMKIFIVSEVEVFIGRPNLPSKALYYAMVFLNQILFGATDTDVAKKCLDIYFRTFQTIVSLMDQENKAEKDSKAKSKGKPKHGKKDKSQVGKPESISSKLLSSILLGVHRAIPYSPSSELSAHSDVLYKFTHSNGAIMVLALQLIFQIETNVQIQQHSGSSKLSDRFYRSLYSALFHENIGSKSAAIFLNLIWKSIKLDQNMGRVRAFGKRLLQIAAQRTAGFACGTLILISELFQLYPEVSKSISLSEPYNALHRSPEFANAGDWSELEILKDHFHPSVCIFARQILDGKKVEYLGDPLKDFSTMLFLDRFMYVLYELYLLILGIKILKRNLVQFYLSTELTEFHWLRFHPKSISHYQTMLSLKMKNL